jgi:hypothetical protein
LISDHPLIYIYFETNIQGNKKLGGKTPTITKDGGGSLPLTIGTEEKGRGELEMLPKKDLVAA